MLIFEFPLTAFRRYSFWPHQFVARLASFKRPLIWLGVAVFMTMTVTLNVSCTPVAKSQAAGPGSASPDRPVEAAPPEPPDMNRDMPTAAQIRAWIDQTLSYLRRPEVYKPVAEELALYCQSNPAFFKTDFSLDPAWFPPTLQKVGRPRGQIRPDGAYIELGGGFFHFGYRLVKVGSPSGNLTSAKAKGNTAKGNTKGTTKQAVVGVTKNTWQLILYREDGADQVLHTVTLPSSRHLTETALIQKVQAGYDRQIIALLGALTKIEKEIEAKEKDQKGKDQKGKNQTPPAAPNPSVLPDSSTPSNLSTQPPISDLSLSDTELEHDSLEGAFESASQSKIQLLLRFGKVREAREACALMLKQRPAHWWAQLVNALVKDAQGAPQQAEQQLAAWVKQNPNFFSYLDLAYFYQFKEQPQKAAAAMAEATRYTAETEWGHDGNSEYRGYAAAWYAYHRGQYAATLKMCNHLLPVKINGDYAKPALRALREAAQKRLAGKPASLKWHEDMSVFNPFDVVDINRLLQRPAKQSTKQFTKKK